VFTLAGAAVSWLSKLQTVVALSSTEDKYMVATQVCKEAIWIQRLMEELRHKQQKIFCIVTVKVPCILQGIQPFIQGQNILEYNITLFGK